MLSEERTNNKYVIKSEINSPKNINSNMTSLS